MKYFFVIMALSGITLPALSESGSERIYLSSRFNIPVGVSAVVSMREQAAIAIIGPIDSNVLASYRSAQSALVATTLFIDSEGGDVASAIAIADDIRTRNIRLVVAGKCFSACANYIFAGARHKNVVTGSLIGIHSSQLHYYTDNGIVSIAQRHRKKMENLDVDGNIKKQLTERAKLEEDFFSRIGVSKGTFSIFEDYQLRFENSIAKKYAGCQKIDMWILSKNQLENMGVKGLEAIWMPKTAQEVTLISKDLGLNASNVFFGSEQQLNGACKNF